MSDQNLEVRIHHCKQKDLDILLEMIDEDGWSTSSVDVRASLEIDPEGLLVAVDDKGSAVGFIGAIKMSPELTYVGYFIVRKDLRGKGFGKKLWSSMLDVTKNHTLVLDCAPNMKTWYTEKGFIYEIFTYTFCKAKLSSIPGVPDNLDYDIVPFIEETIPLVIAYDAQLYPYSRENVLRAWSRGINTYSVVAVRNKVLIGYANCHWKNEKHCNIRAIYADNKSVADSLLWTLLQKVSVGSTVAFNVFSDKPIPDCFSDFLCCNTVHKLSTKEVKGINTERIYCNTSHMV